MFRVNGPPLAATAGFGAPGVSGYPQRRALRWSPAAKGGSLSSALHGQATTAGWLLTICGVLLRTRHPVYCEAFERGSGFALCRVRWENGFPRRPPGHGPCKDSGEEKPPHGRRPASACPPVYLMKSGHGCHDGGRVRDQHVVLASADSRGFVSLRQPATPRRERYVIGRSLRKRVPRSALGRVERARRRADPVQQIIASHEGRVDWLIPVRVGRMVASPYGFLRGTAAIMAEDFAAPSRHRHHAGHLRRRAPGQLRLLRLARARPRLRPQRLRRGPPGRLGVGPAPAGGEHLGGRTAERLLRARRARPRSRACVAAYREQVRVAGRAAAAGPVLRAAGRRPAAGETATGARCARRSSGPPAGRGSAPATGRCPGSPSSATAAGGSSRSRR